MFIDLAASPLPSLTAPPPGMRRARGIDRWNPDRRALARFRRIAETIGAEAPPPGFDALAAAARVLAHDFAGHRRAPSIRLRLRCLTALRTMSAEPAWDLAAGDRERIASITAYARGVDRLIPDSIPVIGGLDDAVLVELAWPSLRLELDDYLDFRRLRAEEAALRGVPPHRIGFDREQWRQARATEQALLRHVRRCGLGSYALTPSAPLFRVRG